MKVEKLVEILYNIAPFDRAYDWDNNGLMVGNAQDEITSVYLTLDADAYALKRAKELSANVVISHHPLIFDKLSSVTAGGLAYWYIKEGISVISVHTPLDMAKGGVNDCLAKALELEQIEEYFDGTKPIGRKGKSKISDGVEFAELIKKNLDLDGIECIINRPVNSVLVVSGSGGGEIENAYFGGYDTLVTGEAKHDRLVYCDDHNMNIFVLGHFASENIVLDFLQDEISKYVPCHKSDRKRLTHRR